MPSFPDFATARQIERLENIIEITERFSGPLKYGELAAYLRSMKNSAELDIAIEAFEAQLASKRGVLGEFAKSGKSAKIETKNLPEGAHAIGTTTKPRMAELTDPELLAAELTKHYGPRPPGHEAHHIVPKEMLEAEEARLILLDADISINSWKNGIWLPKDPSIANVSASEVHSKVHTPRAIKIMTEKLREGAKDGPTGVRRALREIRENLSDLRYQR